MKPRNDEAPCTSPCVGSKKGRAVGTDTRAPKWFPSGRYQVVATLCRRIHALDPHSWPQRDTKLTGQETPDGFSPPALYTSHTRAQLQCLGRTRRQAHRAGSSRWIPPAGCLRIQRSIPFRELLELAKQSRQSLLRTSQYATLNFLLFNPPLFCPS